MTMTATEYRDANIDKARARDRERYERNKEARKAAVLLRQHQKRADELGVSLEEFRSQLAAKKFDALSKKITKARAKVQKAYSPRPGEVGYRPPQRKAMGVSKKARRVWLKDPELVAKKRQAAEDETEDHILGFLVQDHAALEAKYASRRALEAAAKAYREKVAAEAEARRQDEETERLERLRAQYRREFEQCRSRAWPGLDPDTYATGRMFGDILETREGRPLSLEHQAIITLKGVVSVEDMNRLAAQGDPEITRIRAKVRSRLARYRPEQALHERLHQP